MVLRVVSQGDIYLGGYSKCCKRCFITFQGAECSGPLPIDTARLTRDHRHGAIEGYCDIIGIGNIRVGINIGHGDCPGYEN